MRPLLGAFVAVEAETAIGSDTALAIEAAFTAVQRVSDLMHPTRAGSDLERIALARPGTPVQVDDWTLRVLRQSAELNRQSKGSFDPCLPGARGRMPDIEIHADHVVCRAPVSLDLGGIAKGFAVDVAVAELRRHGCVAGMVNAGGDLRVFGPKSRVVYVRGPAGEGIPIELLDAALAVSEPRSDAAPSEHRGYYEGMSGRPVIGRAVAVIATTAMIADALCKCALLCAPTLLTELLVTYGARLPQVTVSRFC